MYGRVAVALSESAEALGIIDSAPARKRHPNLVLAALHDLVLAGEAPSLAAAFAAAGNTTRPAAGAGAARVGDVAVEVLVGMADAVLERVRGRTVRADEGGRHALLYPAIGEAARRVGSDSAGLIGIGRPAGLNLTVDRVGVAYGNGQSLGDSASAVQVAASVVHDGRVATVAMPEIVARVTVGADLVDVTDAAEARWLRACVPPDQVDRLARLEAELALAAAEPPVLVPGEVVVVLPEAIARVPDGVLPVVMTTWVLSNLDLEERLRFLQRLDEARRGGRSRGCPSRASELRPAFRRSVIDGLRDTASSE